MSFEKIYKNLDELNLKIIEATENAKELLTILEKIESKKIKS